MPNTEIFISYAWGNAEQEDAMGRERIVNDLVTSLQKDNYQVVRDKQDLSYSDLISEFMDRIGDGYSIVIVISDKYLKSEFCLYEFNQIFRNSASNLRKMLPRIFPIVLGDALIYSENDRIAYINYWQQQKASLLKAAADVNPENRGPLDKKLKFVSELTLNIGDWINFLSDMVAPGGLQGLIEGDFKLIKARLKARLASLAPGTFNQVLIRRLIEALAIYDPDTRQLLTDASEQWPDWENALDNKSLYLEKIIESYPGIVGDLLGDVMAIGNRVDREKNYNTHIETCILTARMTLQLLFFTHLVRLWDYVDKTGPFNLQPEENAALEKFFQSLSERGLDDYLGLLRIMTGVFNRIPRETPFPEIDWQQLLRQNGTLSNACRQLLTIPSGGDTREFSLQAEQAIAAFFSELAFLSVYKMVSVKNIGYYSLRNAKPHYLHEYAPVGNLEKVGPDNQKRQVQYMDLPCNNDVVMLYKDKYYTGINLFPFIIDINALQNNDPDKVQIAFYAARGSKKDSFRYTRTDANPISISGSEQEILDTMLNQLFIDREGKQKINEYNVVRQLKEVKEKILNK